MQRTQKSIEQLELEFQLFQLQDDNTLDAVTKQQKVAELQQQLSALENQFHGISQLRG